MRKGMAVMLCFLQCFAAGCSSIVQGTRQDVHVVTNPPGAMIFNSYTHEESVSPAQLVLKRKHEYELRIEKEGYKTQYVQIDRQLSGWFWGNLFSFGLIGGIVDVVNGSGYKLEPKEVEVQLQKL